MVYKSTHHVLIPNFRNDDSCNPFQKRSLSSLTDEIEYIIFQQGEINEFLGDNSQGRVTLEDLMIEGRFNVTPFRKNDSLLPVLFGGLMLGEGCLTQEETRFCTNPRNDYNNVFSERTNKKVYFCRINSLIEDDTPKFTYKGNVLFFFDKESARESLFRQSSIDNAPEGLEINPITNVVRYRDESIVLTKYEMKILSSIDRNIMEPRKVNKTDEVLRSKLNNGLKELCGMYVAKPRGRTYCFKSV